VKNLILTTRQSFYHREISENSGNQKKLHKVIGKLLHCSSEPEYPTHNSPEELCDRFADFFSDKVDKIRLDIENSQNTLPPTSLDVRNTHTDVVFSDFKLLNSDEVLKLIQQSPTKSCPLDPIPTWVLKKCATQLVPIIMKIINTSLSSSLMPDQLKEALLSPLLKKLLLDPDILKHFRPISNLAYLSKLVEKSVDIQLVSHIMENGLNELFQSAYKQFYSTETALLKVHNDFMCAIDSGHAVILMMIDMSAAFDTVDHEILLQHLYDYLGITGNALAWFRSYLQDRKQTVHLLGSTSTKRDLKYGVPQGSILGPHLFSIYTLPVGHIIRKYYSNAKFMFFVDDKQLYLVFDPCDPLHAASSIESLITDVQAWLIRNFLMVNDTKTDGLVASSRHRPAIVFPPVRVGDDFITPSTSVKNLGFIFDTHMTMEKQINSVVRQSFLSLRDMYKVCQCLPMDATETMVHSFVTTRLDYCNSLYYGLPARLVTNTSDVL